MTFLNDFRLLGIVAGFCVLVGAGQAGEAKYAIKFSPRYHVGQKCEFSSSGTETSRWLRVGQDGDAEHGEGEYSARFEGVAEVVAADAEGRIERLKVVVSKMTQEKDGKESEVLPKGRVVVVVRKADGNDVLIDDKPVSKPVKTLVQSAMFLSVPGLGPDEVFGTSKKQKVGGKWKCDSKILAKYFSLGETSVAPENVEGEVELEKVIEIGGGSIFGSRSRPRAIT